MGVESLNHALVGCHHACQLRMAIREHWTLPDEEQFLNIDHLNFLVFSDAGGKGYESKMPDASVANLASEERYHP